MAGDRLKAEMGKVNVAHVAENRATIRNSKQLADWLKAELVEYTR